MTGGTGAYRRPGGRGEGTLRAGGAGTVAAQEGALRLSIHPDRLLRTQWGRCEWAVTGRAAIRASSILNGLLGNGCPTPPGKKGRRWNKGAFGFRARKRGAVSAKAQGAAGQGRRGQLSPGRLGPRRRVDPRARHQPPVTSQPPASHQHPNAGAGAGHVAGVALQRPPALARRHVPYLDTLPNEPDAGFPAHIPGSRFGKYLTPRRALAMPPPVVPLDSAVTLKTGPPLLAACSAAVEADVDEARHEGGHVGDVDSSVT